VRAGFVPHVRRELIASMKPLTLVAMACLQRWYATTRVWVNRPDNSCIMAEIVFNDRLLT